MTTTDVSTFHVHVEADAHEAARVDAGVYADANESIQVNFDQATDSKTIPSCISTGPTGDTDRGLTKSSVSGRLDVLLVFIKHR